MIFAVISSPKRAGRQRRFPRRLRLAVLIPVYSPAVAPVGRPGRLVAGGRVDCTAGPLVAPVGLAGLVAGVAVGTAGPGAVADTVVVGTVEVVAGIALGAPAVGTAVVAGNFVVVPAGSFGRPDYVAPGV